MHFTRRGLYGTSGNVRYLSCLIRDTWGYPSLVCLYTPGLTQGTVDVLKHEYQRLTHLDWRVDGEEED